MTPPKPDHRVGARPAGRPVFDKLPAYYREHPELSAPFVAAAEDLLASTAQVLYRREERVSSRLTSEPQKPDWATTEAIAQRLQERLSAAPLVWNGLEGEAHPSGGVVFRRAERPSAVLAWDRTVLSALPPGFRISRRALPAGVRVQGVILARMPSTGRPRIGERYSGEIAFRSFENESEHAVQ